MPEKKNVVKPSIQLMELFAYCEKFSTLQLLERISDFQFYSTIETSICESASEGAKIRKICDDNNIRWVSWASRYIIGEKLNLSSIDECDRVKAVSRLKGLMKASGDVGAEAFSVLSGPVPSDPSKIPDALKAAETSLCELAAAAKQYPGMDLLIEPLDRDVHKKNTVGPTKDAISIIKYARKENPRVFMAWDSAHVSLMKEDLGTSLCISGDTVGQLHLCNAVLDPDDPLYGDFHMQPGLPGYLTELRAADIISRASKLELSVEYLPVAVEVRPDKDADPWVMEEYIRTFLAEAIRLSLL